MGQIESTARERKKKENIRSALLAAVGLTGVVLVAAVAPNLPVALSRLPSMQRAKLKYQYRSVLGRLAAQGYVIFEQRDGKKYARITDKGRKTLALEQEKGKLDLSKKRRWDRRWRVVIFDVPERRRVIRGRLRRTMQELGFVRLQDSVWVFPYDCEDFVALLKADLKIGHSVLYMIVEEIENDKRLREHFALT